ncbi:hypothetical protein ACFQ3C_10520 [Seohaeicola saemankumensis]|uniref:Uncharacterized protein n=1 Tax=Seohaeicola saemankumensis TaxID=481181 RepID=A0ABW3TD39_9RHOB
MGNPVETFPRVLSWPDEGEDLATRRLTDEIRLVAIQEIQFSNPVETPIALTPEVHP